MEILDFFSKNQKLIISSCLLLVAVFFIDKPLGVGLLLVLFLSAVSLFFINKYNNEKERKVLGILFLIVFTVHILGVLLIYYTNFQPFSGGGGDYIVYQHSAELVAQRVSQGNISLQGVNLDNYYPIIIGYIYALTIPSALIGQLFNAWLVALLIIFAFLIVRQLGGSQREGFLTGLVISIYPSLAFYGSLLLKDALVVLLCLIGLLLILKIVKNFSILKFIVFFIVLTGLIHFRFYVGYALMFGFIISWFLVSNLNLKKRIIYGIILLFLLGFSPQILGNGYYGSQNIKAYLTVDKITLYRETVFVPPSQRPQPQPESISAPVLTPTPTPTLTPTPAPAPAPAPASTPAPVSQPKPPVKPDPDSDTRGRGSSVVVKTGLENPITFVKNTSISFAYALLGPFPWQLNKLSQLLVLPEVLGWYILMFFIVKGIISFIKRRDMSVLPLIIFSILVLGVVALFMGNFGVATRIRMSAFVVLLCLFAFGLGRWENNFLEKFFIKIPFLGKLFN